ncbi:OmpW family protein [Candidatus Trichorickettsia mobilis]|uniref:OmpW family protein n=1 Tax=Candidatus Trichorickettsia mobilis TaxID=1346319 RepID=A0ABZ0USW5_9RICK|nr:OmpW family protein [Candidatus Trichorickettsia mobilis]
MKHIAKYFFSICLMLAIMISAAIATAKNTEKDIDDDYSADYYSDEGKLLFKVRGYGIASNAKQKGLPKSSVAAPASTNPFVENGYGGDTATTIFFNDNMAAELSLGFGVLNTKYSTLNNVAHNYGGQNTAGKKKKIYMVPLTGTAQYHIAPYGAIRPYVGAGYHGAYLFTKAKEFKIKNGHGAVLQIGVDFVAKDDTFINVDIRKYFLKAKVTYKGALVKNATNISSTAKIDPLVVSAGIGFKL